jgi:hypothetical protein
MRHKACGAMSHHRDMSRQPRRPGKSNAEIRVDYLRRLGTDVDAVLSLIVRDLVTTGALARDEAESTVRVRAAEHLGSRSALGMEINA